MYSLNRFSFTERITFLFMFLLLIFRFVDYFFGIWISSIVKLDSYKLLVMAGVYLLTAFIIWSNKQNLADLHIDKNFIRILIIAGLILSAWYLPIELGLFTGIATFILFQELRSGQMIFQERKKDYREHLEMVSLTFLGLSVFIPSFSAMFANHNSVAWDLNSIFKTIYKAGLPLVIYEEVLFRGTLWMFLRKFKMGEIKIFIAQSLLFWFAHYYYLFSSPNGFWLPLPLWSFLFGWMVLRSKSLTPVTIAHFLVNLLGWFVVK